MDEDKIDAHLEQVRTVFLTDSHSPDVSLVYSKEVMLRKPGHSCFPETATLLSRSLNV